MATPTKSAPSPAAAAKTATKTVRTAAKAAPATAMPLSLGAMGAAMDKIDILDQHGLNEYLESGRRLLHALAMNIVLQGGQVEAGLKEQAKSNAKFNIPGWSARMAIRRVLKRMNGSADHCASAAGDLVGAWVVFEREFESVLAGSSPKPAAAKGFTIAP